MPLEPVCRDRKMEHWGKVQNPYVADAVICRYQTRNYCIHGERRILINVRKSVNLV